MPPQPRTLPSSPLQILRTFRQTQTPFVRRTFQRRAESTASSTVASGAEQSPFQKIWNSNVGPKTVHFWAPIMKWGLVLAGVSDFARPAESLSLTQNLALMGTGAIWTRWCFVIRPRNVFLAAVNFFLFCVGTTQVTRVLLYQSSQANTDVGTAAKGEAKREGEIVQVVVKDPEGAVDRAGKSAKA